MMPAILGEGMKNSRPHSLFPDLIACVGTSAREATSPTA